jgi:hypothetical protein
MGPIRSPHKTLGMAGPPMDREGAPHGMGATYALDTRIRDLIFKKSAYLKAKD